MSPGLEFELLPDPFKRPPRTVRGLGPARVWRLGWLAAIGVAAFATAFVPGEFHWPVWAAFLAGAAPALLSLPLSGESAREDDRVQSILLVLWAVGGSAAAVLTGGVSGAMAAWCLAPVAAASTLVSSRRLAEGAALLRAKSQPAAVIAAARPTLVSNGSPDVSAAVAQAHAAAAACQDLDALAAAIAAFDGCPLKTQGAKQAVVSRGPGDAPLMIIGEGPGADEDAQGQPFVGRAGQLLDRMLKAAGLTDRVFITNTVFWRPPGNRTPTPQEQAVCAPFLERAIALVNPKMLLLIGGASAKAMLKREEGILSLRGRWFEWTSSDGSRELPALPTLHPAFLLRQPAAKKKAWQDLLTLTERLDRPERPH